MEIPWAIIALTLLAVGIGAGLVFAYPRIQVYMRRRMLRKLHERVVRPPPRVIGKPKIIRKKLPEELLRRERERLRRIEKLMKAKKRKTA